MISTETVPPFFSSLSPAFFARPQLPRESPRFFLARLQLPRKSPLFFLARSLFSLAPNYRDSLPFFSSRVRFFRSPPTSESVPPFFFLVLHQLPRAWNRLSENLQSSCLFSTQCLRIEKSILLVFDRDQYYVLPK